MSVCRTWRKISIEGSGLWENVHILPQMPDLFLDLVLGRVGGRPLAVHFRACDFRTQDIPPHQQLHRGYLAPLSGPTVILAAHRIKSFTTQVTDPPWQRETCFLLRLFQTAPYPDLESLDISYNAFYTSASRAPGPPLYRPDITNSPTASILMNSIPTVQLKHLTLRHVKGWPPMFFGNLTHLTLFGYADGEALAEAVRENPALRKLRLESIKNKERYSYHPSRLVNLDGQTLELVRCEPGVLHMFTLSPSCSLVIIRTMDQYAITYEGVVPEFQWFPDDISKIRCLHGLEELCFSVTKVTRRKGWTAAEQKTVGYPTSDSTGTTGSELKPLVTLILTYHYDTTTPLYEFSFEPLYLLPRPISWGKVTRASFDGFSGQFKICDNTVHKALPNLRSLTLRRCASDFLVRFLMPGELLELESLRFEDELSMEELGDTLANVLGVRRMQSGPAGLQLGDLKILTAGDPSSVITTEQTEKLREFVYSVEVARAPGYRPVVNTIDV